MPWAAAAFESGSPSMNLSVYHRTPSVSPESYTEAMFGWSREAASWAS